MSLEIDGHVNRDAAGQRGRERVGLGLVLALHAERIRRCTASCRAGNDPMPADNTFDFVLTPSQSVSILVVDSGSGNSSFYLSKALGHRQHADLQRRDRARRPGHAADAGAARGGPAERRDAAARARWWRAEDSTSKVEADCLSPSASTPTGRRTKPISCQGSSGRSSTAWTAAARRSAFATTAIRSSKCSRRLAAATSRPLA